MASTLRALPFAKGDLAPVISEETVDFHYGKHHQTYVDNLNRLIAGSALESQTLPELIRTTTGAIFNNAAQVWNHDFYWDCLSKAGTGGVPSPELSQAFQGSFGSLAEFRQIFTQQALALFGAGWVWLVKTPAGLKVMATSNADNPLRELNVTPLLTCDVWEHAYYIDYRNSRAKYLEEFWSIVNWQWVNRQFAGALKNLC